jgi:nucleotide-binding universal stress UspA family protein
MRILIGSDLSPASDEAVRQALDLARAPGSELGVCHVLPEPQLRSLFPQQHESDLAQLLALQPRVAEALRAQVQRLSEGAAQSPQIFVEQGSEYAELVRRAQEWTADLIVVGGQREAGLAHSFLRGVPEHVVRHAHCPVLVARARAEGVVLVATDLSDPAQLALEAGVREAARRKRRLVIVHATEPLSRRTEAAMALFGIIPISETAELRRERAEFARQILQSALQRAGAHGEVQIVEGRPSTEILRLVEALPVELLVLGTLGRSAVSRMMLGSVATDVVRHARCSVLAIRLAASEF